MSKQEEFFKRYRESRLDILMSFENFSESEQRKVILKMISAHRAMKDAKKVEPLIFLKK